MRNPLRIWLDRNGLSVDAFCEGRSFSTPTVYRLLKATGEFSTRTLADISAATGGAVTASALLAGIEMMRTGRASHKKNEAKTEPEVH